MTKLRCRGCELSFQYIPGVTARRFCLDCRPEGGRRKKQRTCKTCQCLFYRGVDGGGQSYCGLHKPGKGANRKKRWCIECGVLIKKGDGSTTRHCSSHRVQGGQLKMFDHRFCGKCGQSFAPTSSTHVYCGDCGGRRFWDKYGITKLQRDEMFLAQKGVCLLCPRPANRVDHDHRTGRVRGLLCHCCNIALSEERFEEPAWRQKAIVYIGQASLPEEMAEEHW